MYKELAGKERHDFVNQCLRIEFLQQKICDHLEGQKLEKSELDTYEKELFKSYQEQIKLSKS